MLQQQCVDIGEPVYDMKLLGLNELVYWTETQANHCSFNFVSFDRLKYI